MNLEITLISIALCGGVFGLSAWRSSRPSVPGKVRMIPWTLIAIVSATLALFLTSHLLGLFGIETGGGRRAGF